MNLQAQQDTLFYIGDPMCSWCYGFAPEVSKIKTGLDENTEFKIVVGGLRPNGQETMTDLGDFLKHHWEEVAQRSGQPFSYDILQQKEFIYDTEPSCRAVITVRQLAPEKELDFFKAIQTAFYHKNQDTHALETYQSIAKAMDIDVVTFSTFFQSDAAKMVTHADFQLSAAMGVRGFPSMVLKKGEEYHLVSNGYQEAANILAKIKQIQAK